MPSKWRIYTTRTCGYCHAAVRLLRAKRIEFEQIDVTGDEAARDWLYEVTGRTTVPQVFCGEQSLGGYTDIAELERTGELDRLIAGG